MTAPLVIGGGDPRPLLELSFALARGLGAGDGIGFYGGEAGIGWALAHASAIASDDALAVAATARLEHVAAAEPEAVGLADGLAGVAFALLDGGQRLGDERLQAAGRSAAARIAETTGDADYLTGLGGAIALLATSVRNQRVGPELLDGARAAGERVIDLAHRTPWGWGWDVPALDTAPPLCGMAHGSAGMAVAFHELAAATGDARWAEPADQALRYVRAHFRRASGGWPDLRVAAFDDPSLDASCGSSWCHGAAGIGLAFLRIHELTGDRGALADASAALQAARRGVGALAGGSNTDASLCHGTGGIVELYACAARILGGSDHLRAARRVAHLAVDVSRRAGGAWTAGDERDPDAAGLFLGQAGVVTWLLRAVDPGALPSPLLLR